MENTNRDTAQTAAPQYDWQDDETNQNNELPNAEPNRYGTTEEDEQIHVMAGLDVPDPDDEDEEESEDDEDEDDGAGDWGHVDPAEGNSPFPDGNEPGFPGSAV